MDNVAPRAALYARISKEDPDVESTADQLRECRTLAEREGYEIVGEYEDGISAWSGKIRPGWLNLLSGLTRGEFDVIVARHEDRLARTSEEKIGLQAECARRKVTWHTVYGGRVDPRTSGGKLMGTITGAVAQYESDVKSERIRASVVRRRLEGRDVPGGNRAFGFTMSRDALVEPEAELLRQAHRMILEGRTVWAVTQAWKASGVNPVRGGTWNPRNVYLALLRPRNGGYIVDKDGNEYALLSGGVVERAEHEEVVRILTASRDTRGRKPLHLGSGKVTRCSVCGYSTVCQPERPRRPRIYRCGNPNGTKGHGHGLADVIDAQIEAEVLPALMARLSGDDGSVDLRPLLAQEAALEGERTRITEIATLPGADLSVTRKRLSEIQGELADVRDRMIQARTANAESVQALARDILSVLGSDTPVEDLAQRAAAIFLDRWDAMSLEDKRDLVVGLLDVRVTPEGKPVIDPRGGRR